VTDIHTPYSRATAKTFMETNYQRMLSTAGHRIDDLSALCHLANNAAGWWLDSVTREPKPRNFGELIALMHSELSEALEGDRKDLLSDKIPGFTAVEEEFADLLIRLFDTAGAKQLRLGDAFLAKMRYNQTRPDHQLENRAKPDGKKY